MKKIFYSQSEMSVKGYGEIKNQNDEVLLRFENELCSTTKLNILKLLLKDASGIAFPGGGSGFITLPRSLMLVCLRINPDMITAETTSTVGEGNYFTKYATTSSNTYWSDNNGFDVFNVHTRNLGSTGSDNHFIFGTKRLNPNHAGNRVGSNTHYGYSDGYNDGIAPSAGSETHLDFTMGMRKMGRILTFDHSTQNDSNDPTELGELNFNSYIAVGRTEEIASKVGGSPPRSGGQYSSSFVMGFSDVRLDNTSVSGGLMFNDGYGSDNGQTQSFTAKNTQNSMNAINDLTEGYSTDETDSDVTNVDLRSIDYVGSKETVAVVLGGYGANRYTLAPDDDDEAVVGSYARSTVINSLLSTHTGSDDGFGGEKGYHGVTKSEKCILVGAYLLDPRTNTPANLDSNITDNYLSDQTYLSPLNLNLSRFKDTLQDFNHASVYGTKSTSVAESETIVQNPDGLWTNAPANPTTATFGVKPDNAVAPTNMLPDVKNAMEHVFSGKFVNEITGSSRTHINTTDEVKGTYTIDFTPAGAGYFGKDRVIGRGKEGDGSEAIPWSTGHTPDETAENGDWLKGSHWWSTALAQAFYPSVNKWATHQLTAQGANAIALNSVHGSYYFNALDPMYTTTAGNNADIFKFGKITHVAVTDAQGIVQSVKAITGITAITGESEHNPTDQKASYDVGFNYLPTTSEPYIDMVVDFGTIALATSSNNLSNYVYYYNQFSNGTPEVGQDINLSSSGSLQTNPANGWIHKEQISVAQDDPLDGGYTPLSESLTSAQFSPGWSLTLTLRVKWGA